LTARAGDGTVAVPSIESDGFWFLVSGIRSIAGLGQVGDPGCVGTVGGLLAAGRGVPEVPRVGDSDGTGGAEHDRRSG
jgi:hypothetical protein